MEVFNNKYRLDQQLGRGAFSEVWKATDLQTNVVFALKIYKPLSDHDNDGMEMMRREFSIVSNAIHQNLITPRIFDICDQRPFLVLNFSERGNISRCKGLFTEREAWQLLHDVAAGLNYLHTRMRPPIIHQDIKPANILMGDDGSYKITDFGVSIQAKNTLSQLSIKKNPLLSAGTIAYMGPERFSADNRPLAESDVWSLGAMMFEMITGRPPFGEDGGLFQFRYEPEVPDVGKAYTLQLRNVLRRCLLRSPQQRPSAAYIEALCNDMLGVLPRGGRMFPVDEWTDERPTVAMNSDELQQLVDNYQSATMQNEATWKMDYQPQPMPPQPSYSLDPEAKSKEGKALMVWLRQWFMAFGATLAAVLLLAAFAMGVRWLYITLTAEAPTPHSPVVPPIDTTATVQPAVGQPIKPDTTTKTEPRTETQTTPEHKRKDEPEAKPKKRKLSYGHWTGRIKDRKPDGQGTLTLTASHAFFCNNGEIVVMDAGDMVVDACFTEGVLYNGKWIKKNGKTKYITP